LAERGFLVKELNVGWREWMNEGLPTEKGTPAQTTSKA
jgi:hypothetical protein